jgi:hypothetical protein
MSDLERNLRDVLGRRAAAAPPSQGDWQDLTVRMAKRNRRTKRAMAGALALVLIAGPLAGFAVARSIDDGDAGQVTAGGPTTASELNAMAASAGSADMLALESQYLDASRLEHLFRRTTDDHIEIRGYIVRAHAVCESGASCPAVDCLPDAQIVGQLSNEAAVGYGIGAHYASASPDIKVTGAGFFGANGEGSPAQWTIGQASDRVAKVRASYADGGVDEMAPVDGAVILAAPADPNRSGGQLEAFAADGSLVGHAAIVPPNSINVGSTSASIVLRQTELANGLSAEQYARLKAEIESSSSSSSRSSSSASGSGGTSSSPATPAGDPCVIPPTPTPPTPPASLPAAGEQPADPAAARAEIEQAFATSYDGGAGDTPEKRAAVEDSSVLAFAAAETAKGPYAAQVKDSTAKVTDVVFTSPTEASVRYDINIANYTNFTNRIGAAKLIDGRWKVARETVCTDLTLSGINCPAP